MKILAVVSMLIDHTAIFLFPRFIDASVYTVMRAIGRFAFPVFAYLIVNGYEKTRDVKRYLTRLLAFAVISQIPYVLVGDVNHFPEGNDLVVTLSERWFVCLIFILVAAIAWLTTVRANATVLWPVLALGMAVLRVTYCGVRILSAHLNVFYTLATGLALIALADAVFKPKRDLVRLLMQALGLFGALYLIRDNMDYGSMGVALIFSLWLARGSLFSQVGVMLLWCIVEYVLGRQHLSHFFVAALSVVPVLLYRGQQGPRLKLAFYAVYPVHLAILGALTVYFTFHTA